MNDQMNMKLSELKCYPSLRQWLKEYCEEEKFICWHDYGPAEYSLYDSDPVKILLMNAESGGYEGCQNTPPNEYLKWIRKQPPIPTPRNGAVFVTLIREYIALLLANKPIPPFGRSRWVECRECRKDVDRLIKNMSGTIYMNASVTSNPNESSREDKARIRSDIRKFALYRKRFVEILKPRIVICAGLSAGDSLFIDGGAFPTSSLRKDSVFLIDNCVLVVMPHLSRPQLFHGYKGLHNIGLRCANLYRTTFST